MVVQMAAPLGRFPMTAVLEDILLLPMLPMLPMHCPAVRVALIQTNLLGRQPSGAETRPKAELRSDKVARCL